MNELIGVVFMFDCSRR